MILASRGSVILGPNGHATDDAFRNLMGSRLQAAFAQPGSFPNIPLMIWIIDVSPLWIGAEAAYKTRQALTVLASSLMSALAVKLKPPTQKVNLEFPSERPPTALPSSVRIAVVDGDADPLDDLRPWLKQTSVVCLVGMPPHAKEAKLKLEGQNEDFFRLALLPHGVLTSENLVAGGVPNDLISKILALSTTHEICLGTKIPLQQLRRVSGWAEADLSELDALQQEFTLDSLRYLYWYEPAGTSASGPEVEEQILTSNASSPAIETAILMVLIAACGIVHETGGSKPLPQSTIGRQMIDMLTGHGVEMMSVEKFLNFGSWFIRAAARFENGTTLEKNEE